jgi:hypothetical protein
MSQKHGWRAMRLLLGFVGTTFSIIGSIILATIGTPIAIVLLWEGYTWVRWPSDVFRYKITLSVERNGRFYNASSVIEASQRPTDFLAYFMAKSSIPNFHAKGGVPIVKLGSHGYVFIPFAYWPNYARLP